MHAGYAVVAFLVLLPGVFGRSDAGVVRRFLANRAVQLLGLVSYGIYLWHELWLRTYRRWAGAPAAGLGGSFPRTAMAVLALTVATAAVSWVVIERPLLRRKDRVPRILHRPT